MENGAEGPDRTGFGTKSTFGLTLDFDLNDGFPAVTTKKLAFKQVTSELYCFIHGLDMLKQFNDAGCKVWDKNCKAWPPGNGTWLGRIYGVQWRQWRGFNLKGQPTETDQLKNLVMNLIKDPRGRRHMLMTYNPADLDQQCLPSCNTQVQFYVHPQLQELSCLAYMRSWDMFLGAPFDIAEFALLTHLMAKAIGRNVGHLKMVAGDAHIYKNHFAQVETQLSREPKRLPTLKLADFVRGPFDFLPRDAELMFYYHHDQIKAEMNA